MDGGLMARMVEAVGMAAQAQVRVVPAQASFGRPLPVIVVDGDVALADRKATVDDAVRALRLAGRWVREARSLDCGFYVGRTARWVWAPAVSQ